MNKKSMSLAQLQALKTTLHTDCAGIYQLYHHELIPLLNKVKRYQEQLISAYSIPIIVYEKRNVLVMTNNLLLLHSIKNMNIPTSDLTTQTSLSFIKPSKVSVDKLFLETINLIVALKGKHQINCPYQYLHLQLIKLLRKNDNPPKYKKQCQQLFNKNYYSIKQFCEDVDITTRTYDRSRKLNLLEK